MARRLALVIDLPGGTRRAEHAMEVLTRAAADCGATDVTGVSLRRPGAHQPESLFAAVFSTHLHWYEPPGTAAGADGPCRECGRGSHSELHRSI